MSQRSPGQTTSQLNYRGALKTIRFGAFRCSDESEIFTEDSSECPLHLSSFGFHPILTGRASKYLRHFETSTSQLNYPYAPKTRLLSAFTCSDKPEFFRAETSECPLQLTRFEFLLVRSGRGSNDSKYFGASVSKQAHRLHVLPLNKGTGLVSSLKPVIIPFLMLSSSNLNKI